jgi:hypothetical protein
MLRRLRIWLTLTVLLSGLAAILPQPTAAAANLVTVRVTIEEVRATECFEGTAFDACLGYADFYSFV